MRNANGLIDGPGFMKTYAYDMSTGTNARMTIIQSPHFDDGISVCPLDSSDWVLIDPSSKSLEFESEHGTFWLCMNKSGYISLSLIENVGTPYRKLTWCSAGICEYNGRGKPSKRWKAAIEELIHAIEFGTSKLLIDGNPFVSIMTLRR